MKHEETPFRSLISVAWRLVRLPISPGCLEVFISVIKTDGNGGNPWKSFKFQAKTTRSCYRNDLEPCSFMLFPCFRAGAETVSGHVEKQRHFPSNLGARMPGFLRPGGLVVGHHVLFQASEHAENRGARPSNRPLLERNLGECEPRCGQWL